MNDHDTWEQAHTRSPRAVSHDDEIRGGLARLAAGALCEDCKWQPATTLIRRKVLVCASCAAVDAACRSIEANYKRLHRHEART